MTKLRIVTINVRGLASGNRFLRFIQTASSWAKKGVVDALCLQEHNLAQASEKACVRIAQDYGFHLVLSFSQTPGHRGGSLILAAERTLTFTKVIHREQSMVRALYDFNGTEIDIASVYAPSDDKARLNFFSHMKSNISSKTVVGGDWNCVPDVLLDVRGRNQLKYPNVGASQLNKLMSELGLADYRREQLEDDFEHTRKPESGDDVITRLDR